MTTVAGVADPREAARPVETARLVDAAAWAALIGALAFVAGLRVQAMGPGAPPGPDPGAFLAFARRLAGEPVMLRGTLYPPLVPALVALLGAAVGPLAALKIAGAAGSAAIGLPCYAIARRGLAPWLALPAALGVVLSGYHVEVLAFGGYAGLWGEALLLAALLALDAYLVAPSRRGLVLAALAASLLAGVHTLSAVTFAAVAAALAAWRLPRAGARTLAARLGAVAGVALVFALPYAPTYLYMLREAAGPAFNMHGWTRPAMGEAFAYVFRNGVGLWYALLGIALVTPWARSPATTHVRPFVFALTAVPLTLFAWQLEIRALQYLFAGLVLGAACAAAIAAEGRRPAARAAATAAMLALVVAIGAGERAWTRQAYPWYRMATGGALAGLRWLARETPRDAIVAASVGPHGMPMGWWVEGLSGRRALTAIELRWLAFHDEREYAAAANAVFAPRTPPDRARAILRRHGVGYLFVDRRALPHAIVQFPPPLFEPAFESAEALVLRVR